MHSRHPQRLFAFIKETLLSFGAGIDSLPADYSGWALLRHLLPILQEVDRWKRIAACCQCHATISAYLSVFEEDANEETLLSVIGDLPFFIEQKNCLPTENEMKLDLSSPVSIALHFLLLFFASPLLQDQVNARPLLQFQIISSSSNGISLRAAISEDKAFTGREEELAAIANAIQDVMDKTSHAARRVVVLHGNPGIGKSLLAAQALVTAQKQLSNISGNQDIRFEIVRGRGAAVVEEDFVTLGRSLGGLIGIHSDSPPQVLLKALEDFFKRSRYVLLIDDADAEGLSRALHFLSVSKQPHALIITSQSLTPDSIFVDFGHLGPIQFHKLDLFKFGECMSLTTKICKNCEVFLRKREDDLRAAFDGLNYLPLAVRLFAEWSRNKFNEIMKPHEQDIKIKLKAFLNAAMESAKKKKFEKLEQEQAEADFWKEYEAATGHGAAAADALLRQWKSAMGEVVLHADAKYSRGLLGTVRLALLQLESLPSDIKEASKQLLGLLSLCPHTQVPWSLFDGGAKGEAHLLVRGARVEVTGTSLEYVPPVGERCRIKCDYSPLKGYARIINVLEDRQLRIEDYEGNVSEIDADDVEFDPQIGRMHCDQGGKIYLQLVKPIPATGVKVSIDHHEFRGRFALIKSHYLLRNGTKLVQDGKSTLSVDDMMIRLQPIEFPEEELQLKLSSVQLPKEVAIIDGQLFLPPRHVLPVNVTSRRGRVIQNHAGNGTVSVVFGCDSGECNVRHPHIFELNDSVQVK